MIQLLTVSKNVTYFTFKQHSSKDAKNEYKTSHNVTKVALFLGIFIEIP